MKDSSFFGKIYIAAEPVDFRRQAHGLALLVEEGMNHRLRSQRELFVFTNKRRNAVKCLYWDNTGLALWWKNLEKESFKWPNCKNEPTYTVSSRELIWLLEGVDLTAIKKHKNLQF